ncbi:MAG: Mth938-like domain-containing protein [Roseovarius sp.]
MRLSEISFGSATPIDGYGPGFFRIGGQVLAGDVLVRAQGAAQWGGLQDLPPLLALAEEIDVLLIGTGAETRHLPLALREPLEAAGMGVEAMNSPAACRTFNVLIAEGRRVAAALIAL